MLLMLYLKVGSQTIWKSQVISKIKKMVRKFKFNVEIDCSQHDFMRDLLEKVREYEKFRHLQPLFSGYWDSLIIFKVILC